MHEILGEKLDELDYLRPGTSRLAAPPSGTLPGLAGGGSPRCAAASARRVSARHPRAPFSARNAD
jgi:hypothetical protein